MYLPVESDRLIEVPVNREPDVRGCTVVLFSKQDSYKLTFLFAISINYHLAFFE